MESDLSKNEPKATCSIYQYFSSEKEESVKARESKRK